MTTNPPHDPTVEMLLVQLARKYAPRLVPANWQKPGDLRKPLHMLARQLAEYDVVVVLGDRGSQPSSWDIPSAVEECVHYYTQLYRLFSGTFFPSFQHIAAYYYSFSRDNLLIYFEMEAGLVARVMAGYIAPYLVERQQSPLVSDFELIALVDVVLKKLDPDGMDAQSHQSLKVQGEIILKHMLAMPLRQLPLTQFDEPFFTRIEKPAPTPEPPARPSPPPDLPEGDDDGHTRPFVVEDLTDAGVEPEFIRNMNAPVNHDTPPVEDETQPQPPQPEPRPKRRNKRPPAARGTGRLAPIPYWEDVDNE